MWIISMNAWNNSTPARQRETERAESALDPRLRREQAWMSGVLSVNFL